MFENYKDVVGIKEMCEMLGISRPTARKLLDNNAIFFKQLGRKYLIAKKNIENYLFA